MNENHVALIGNDVGAQQQYFDVFRRSEPLEPEKALLLAVLEDAIHCYRKYATARDRVGKEYFREAEEWIMGGRDGWIFAFENVCDLLGLDPQYVRRGLRLSLEPVNERQRKGRDSAPQPRAA
ncbi:MAG: hypothetical protein ACREP5_10235 [Candidatus Binatia bacterium]